MNTITNQGTTQNTVNNPSRAVYELAIKLDRLKRTKPDVYRHVVGLVQAVND